MGAQYFSDQTFRQADLKDLSITAAEFEHCIFEQCDLSDSDLSGGRFVDCEFRQCNLSNAKLRKTLLQEVLFSECKMLGCRFDLCDDFGLTLSFESCQLDHASFYQLKLKKTGFVHCQIREADFTESDLSGARFDHCDLSATVFEDSILAGADLRTSDHYTIDPERNNLKKARLSLSGLPGLLGKYDLLIE